MIEMFLLNPPPKSAAKRKPRRLKRLRRKRAGVVPRRVRKSPVISSLKEVRRMRRRKAGKSRWMSLVKKFGIRGAKARYRRTAANPRKRKAGRRHYRRNIWVDDRAGHRKASLKGWARRAGKRGTKKRKNYARRAAKRYRQFHVPYSLMAAANPRPRRRKTRRYFRRNPGVKAAIAETKKTLTVANLPYYGIGGASMVGAWLLSNRLLKAVGLSDRGLVGFAGNVVTAGLLSGAVALATSNTKVVQAVAFGGAAGAVARFLIEGLLMPQGIGGVALSFAPTTGILAGLGAGGNIRTRIQEAVRRNIAAQAGVSGFLPASAYPGVSGWLPASGVSEEMPEEEEEDDGSFDI